MKSFINLLANDVWSPTDIKSRLHAEFRGQVNAFLETELKRAMLAESKGIHTLTTDENAALMFSAGVEAKVAALGVQARADMALLKEVLALESAQVRLMRPPVEAIYGTDTGVVVNQPELDADITERSAALAAVDAVLGTPAFDLYMLRNPAPAPEPTEVLQ